MAANIAAGVLEETSLAALRQMALTSPAREPLQRRHRPGGLSRVSARSRVLSTRTGNAVSTR